MISVCTCISYDFYSFIYDDRVMSLLSSVALNGNTIMRADLEDELMIQRSFNFICSYIRYQPLGTDVSTAIINVLSENIENIKGLSTPVSKKLLCSLFLTMMDCDKSFNFNHFYKLPFLDIILRWKEEKKNCLFR